MSNIPSNKNNNNNYEKLSTISFEEGIKITSEETIITSLIK